MVRCQFNWHTRFAAKFALCAAMAEVAAALPPRYHVTDLGYLGTISEQYSEGYGINARGQVVGSSGTDEGATHAFLWSPTTPNGTSGTMHDLGTLGTSIEFGSGASSINDSGQVTGRSNVTVLSDEHHAFLWSPTEPNGSSGTMIDLGTPGEYTYAVGVSKSGQVTGSGHNSFLWAPTTPGANIGQWIDWNTLNAKPGTGFGINVSGQVTGLFDTPTGSLHAFLWTPTTPNANTGTLHDLGTLGGTTSWGFAVNAAGQVVGRASTEDESLHAFLWTPTTPGGVTGEMLDLGAFGGALGFSVALAINDNGLVVGVSEAEGLGRAFVYSSAAGMVDLNSLIDPRSGWILQAANAINNAGQITGYGDHDGVRRGFLLTPVPEPSTFALWSVGGVALALSMRSRARRPALRASTKTCQRWALAALTTIVLVNAWMNRAAADLVGPTPYLQVSDSPFAAFTFDYFHLENFEDGQFNVPGVIKSAGNIIGPGLAADSVDADDGLIDGSGNGGRSLFVVAEPLTFTFDAVALGRLPTHVGIVRTDGGNAALGGVASFEAFGPGMISLGTIGPVPFGDGISNGTTAEDRFFGWIDPDGILAVRMPSGVFEVDHLQYGAAVPEPSAAALLVCAFAAFGIYKHRKAALRLGFARISLYAVAALLCRSPTAGATDFVIDQQHYSTSNFINSVGCCDGMGQEFMPTFHSLDIVHLQLERFTPELLVNIREDSITGSIVARSSNTVGTGEHWRVGEFVQFEFEPPISLNPESLYIMEIRSPIPPSPSGTLLVNDGAFQWRDEHRYARGRMIYDGIPSEADIVFRAGSRRVPGTVYETGFNRSERLHLATGPLAGQRDWRVIGAETAVTVSPFPPNQDIDHAIRIAGAGLNPNAGVLSAVALRSSNLHPIDYGNPIVSMKARVRLDGPGTNADGGIDDDLISANVGVTDGAGATIAELILSSNGNAYAFAGNNLYNFETPVTLGEFQTVELRLNYLSRTAEFFLNHERLGALPFAAEVHNVFGEPFFALSASDTPELNPTLYSAWFDDLSIQQMQVPEPASVAIFLFGCIGLFAFYRSNSGQRAIAASVFVLTISLGILPRPASAATFTAANVPGLIDAINAANHNNEPDTIALAPSTVFPLSEVNDTTNGSTGLPRIIADERLTILGNGSVIERSSDSATPNFRLFDIAAQASLALENLTLRNGLADFNSPNGGAIYNAGTLTLSNVLIQNNSAIGRAGALCIRCSSGRGGPGWFGLGAGVYSSGFLQVDASVIRNNEASGGPGGFGIGADGRGGDGDGGGFYLAEGSAIFRGSVVTGNSASGGAGNPIGNGFGGGIYISNAQVGIDEFTLTHMKDNSASTNYSDVFGPFSIIPNPLPGDYNLDGDVNTVDYVVWRKIAGSPEAYNTWRANFGRTSASGATLGATAGLSGSAVPEPTAQLLLLLSAAAPLLGYRTRRKKRAQICYLTNVY